MYIMFPIGWMYYFGTNLENRFSVPNFWPSPEATYKIPFERDEIEHELEIQKARRLLRREQRLQHERALARARGELGHSVEDSTAGSSAALGSLWKAWNILDHVGHDGRQRKARQQGNQDDSSL